MEHGSWIKVYRKEIDSLIWEKPPLYHRVWHWLLLNADYKTGEWTGTYQKIANGVRWIENKKEITPTKRQIRVIIDFLNHVTSTSRTTSHTASHHELSLVIVNWDTYQRTETQPRHTPRHTKSSNHVTTASPPSNYIERVQEVKNLRSKEKTKTNQPPISRSLYSVRDDEPQAKGGVFEFPVQTQNQPDQPTPQPEVPPQYDPQHPTPAPGHEPTQIPPEVYETVSAVSGRIGSTGIPQRKYLTQLASLVEQLGTKRIIEIVDDSLDDIQGARNSWAYIVAVLKNNKTPKPKSNKCPECGCAGFRNGSSVRRYLSTAYVDPRWVDVLHYECPKCKHREKKESEAA